MLGRLNPFAGGQDPPERQNEAQALRLELDDAQRQLEAARRELETLRFTASRTRQEQAEERLEQLFGELATPVAQFSVQRALSRQEVELKPRDLLAVTARLVQALESAGLKLEGEPGDELEYSPDHHQPLSLEESLKPGQPVRLRFPGVSYRGHWLKKAMVEKRP